MDYRFRSLLFVAFYAVFLVGSIATAQLPVPKGTTTEKPSVKPKPVPNAILYPKIDLPIQLQNLEVMVAPRFGLDVNGNCKIDLPLSPDYVSGPLWVELVADVDLAMKSGSSWEKAEKILKMRGLDPGDNPYFLGPWRWRFHPLEVETPIIKLPVPASSLPGVAGAVNTNYVETYSLGNDAEVALFEGRWKVELTRVDAKGDELDREASAKTVWTELEITDYLVVHLGDSYSSGEGAPEVKNTAGYWGDGVGDFSVAEDHRKAHRSSNTWGSRAALLLEESDVTSSVTYINLARAGDVLKGIEAQLNKMDDLIGDRKVDMLLISIGGNDAGFSNAIAAYMLREPVDYCPDVGPGFDDIEDAIGSGNWSAGPLTDVGSVGAELFDWAFPHTWKNRKGMHGLSSGYDTLDGQLTDHGIEASRVFIMTYPDPFVADPEHPDQVCPVELLPAMGKTIVRDFEIGRKEQKHAREKFIIPLNDEIREAAHNFGWNVVDTEKVFYGHSLSNADRFVNRYKESLSLQQDKAGTLHPNSRGHQFISYECWKKMKEKLGL